MAQVQKKGKNRNPKMAKRYTGKQGKRSGFKTFKEKKQRGSQFNSYICRITRELTNSTTPKPKNMREVKDILDESQEKMDMAIMYLEDALAHIRAGKADVRLLDSIRVDSYGSMVPINNVAAVNTPDARSIVIKPWDKSMFRVIEKAIIDSSLGIMPENNGEIIRIGIPPLTEERRKQLAKQCKAEGETAKVSVRNARRDAIDALKKSVKDGLAEDAQKGGEEKLQKIHDKYIKQIDDMLTAKDKEIMTV